LFFSSAIVQAIDNFSYFIPIGFNGKAMTALAAGLSPASFREALFQILTASILRLFTLPQNLLFYKAVRKHRLGNEEKKKQ
jgi:hypothetical protein